MHDENSNESGKGERSAYKVHKAYSKSIDDLHFLNEPPGRSEDDHGTEGYKKEEYVRPPESETGRMDDSLSELSRWAGMDIRRPSPETGEGDRDSFFSDAGDDEAGSDHVHIGAAEQGHVVRPSPEPGPDGIPPDDSDTIGDRLSEMASGDIDIISLDSTEDAVQVTDHPDEVLSPAVASETSEPAAPAHAAGQLKFSEKDLAGIKDRVVTALVRKGLVGIDQVRQARKVHGGKSGAPLWRVLAVQSGVDREAIFAETARIYAFEEVHIEEGRPEHEFVRTVLGSFSEEYRERLLKLRVLPYDYELENKSGMIKLVFVTPDPSYPELPHLMKELEIERFDLRYAPESNVAGILDELYPRRNEYLDRMTEDPMAYDMGTAYEEGPKGLIDEEALEAEISRSTLINLFEAVLVEGVRMGVSDIHIFPNSERKVEFNFRLDGRLQRWHVEDKVHPEAILAVIKDNAVNVDRFERDAAQDGFIQRWIDDTLIRFRVSVLPLASANQDIRAESIVIRILDDRKVITDLTKLGLLPGAREKFDRAIRQPHGMVILTGPTGSGKSTTLVAALHQVVTPEVNVLTVEDPVEYMIKGVRQIKLSHKLGLEGAIRAILRHDPDIVMVGEMRDQPTAELAIKLANTGHLTFSTLHTNDAPSAVSRLYKMGIEPFLLAYAINLVVAQRLIRTLCTHCKEREESVDKLLAEQLGFSPDAIETTTFYKSGSSSRCRTCKGKGYRGRRAITEALYFTPKIREIIVEAGDAIEEEEIRQAAVKEGMLTLSASAREIVAMGDTSLEEMMRVTAGEN